MSELQQHLSWLFGDSNLFHDVYLRERLWGREAGRGISPSSVFPGGALLRFTELLAFPKVHVLCRGHLGVLQSAAAQIAAVGEMSRQQMNGWSRRVRRRRLPVLSVLKNSRLGRL